VTSFESSHPPPQPYMTEVVVSTLGGLEVQAVNTSFTLDAAGDTEIWTETSVLMPRSAVDLEASYTSQRTWSRPNGTMINAHATESDLESQHTQLNLLFGKSGSWEVSGRFQGKSLQASLERDEWIDTSLAEYRGLHEEVVPKGEKQSLALVVWEPSADPTSVLEASFEIGAEDPSRFTGKVGPLELEGRRGADGFIDSAVMRLGPMELETKVVHRSGGL
jgi:hypothetical protein